MFDSASFFGTPFASASNAHACVMEPSTYRPGPVRSFESLGLTSGVPPTK